MIYYRISDKGNNKPKLPGATKEVCFKNFIDCFGNEKIIVIADNCKPETLQMLKNNFLQEIIDVNIGNTASFHLARKSALLQPDEEIIFFAEDDYLYLENKNLFEVIREGLEKVEYLTLFDHPDKYFKEYGAPVNLDLCPGFVGEVSPIYRTKSTRWKLSGCACMTFATKVIHLKEDAEIWDQYELPRTPDYKIFLKLGDKGRKLAVAIPSLAFHTDLSWLTRLNKVEELTEPWAMKYMELKMEQKYPDVTIPSGVTGYQKLLLLTSAEPFFYFNVIESAITAEATIQRNQ
jgi:hypothetical protein